MDETPEEVTESVDDTPEQENCEAKPMQQPVPQPRAQVNAKPIPAPRSPYLTRSRCGHTINPPKRYMQQTTVSK